MLHDLRQGSPTDTVTMAIDVDADNALGVFIPPGVAHGFATLTDLTIAYMVDNYYNPADELGVAWDDPEVGCRLGGKGPRPLRPRQGQPAPSRP